MAERNHTLGDVHLPLGALVSEGIPLPQLRTRGLVDVALEFTARRRRALRPLRQRRSAIPSPTSDCSLLVQVISAHHGPRVAHGCVESKFQNSIPADRESGSFVSATFQEHSRSTMLAIGQSPRWKEILDLPFTPPLGDFSPTNLMQINETLRLSLFSERVVLRGSTVSLQRNDSGTAEFKRLFLGDLEIPFTTLYCNGGSEGLLEGVFRLRKPIVHLGADTKHGAVVIYLHLAIFLRPPLAAPARLPSVVSSLEEEKLISYGINWVQQLRIYLENISDVVKRPVDSHIPNRVIEVFGSNLQGDAVLICRYLKPQRPPPGVDTFERAARFVSLIPFLDDWQSFGCANLDIWCTSQEFLDIGAGDWEEHGILLHNFMWWLQLETDASTSIFDLYLVIGSGIPEGNTIYVLQRDHNHASLDGGSVILWNACSGHAFSALDPRCPLVDIGCIVAAGNIHANLQGVRALHLLSYDFGDGEVWRPFFASRPPNTIVCGNCVCMCNPGPVQMSRPSNLTSVQEYTLQYDAPDILRAEEIQNLITNEIKVLSVMLGSTHESLCIGPSATMSRETKRKAHVYFLQHRFFSAIAKVSCAYLHDLVFIFLF